MVRCFGVVGNSGCCCAGCGLGFGAGLGYNVSVVVWGGMRGVLLSCVIPSVERGVGRPVQEPVLGAGCGFVFQILDPFVEVANDVLQAVDAGHDWGYMRVGGVAGEDFGEVD